jgi:hypothetical protein
MSEDVNVIADYAEVWLVGDDIERAGRRIYQVTDFDQSTNGLIVRCMDETGWSETVWAFRRSTYWRRRSSFTERRTVRLGRLISLRRRWTVSEERIAELEQELEITLADMESLAVQLAETESCYSDTLAELVEREGELEDLNAQFDALEEEVRG